MENYEPIDINKQIDAFVKWRTICIVLMITLSVFGFVMTALDIMGTVNLADLIVSDMARIFVYGMFAAACTAITLMLWNYNRVFPKYDKHSMSSSDSTSSI